LPKTIFCTEAAFTCIYSEEEIGNMSIGVAVLGGGKSAETAGIPYAHAGSRHICTGRAYCRFAIESSVVRY
jgi:hypothetical protein